MPKPQERLAEEMFLTAEFTAKARCLLGLHSPHITTGLVFVVQVTMSQAGHPGLPV